MGSEQRQGMVVRGEVDHSNCGSLTRSLEAATAHESDVRLDLRELSFIDAAGMRAIRDAAEQLRAEGGRLTLVSPPVPVRRLVGLLDMEATLTVEGVA